MSLIVTAGEGGVLIHIRTKGDYNTVVSRVFHPDQLEVIGTNICGPAIQLKSGECHNTKETPDEVHALIRLWHKARERERILDILIAERQQRNVASAGREPASQPASQPAPRATSRFASIKAEM